MPDVDSKILEALKATCSPVNLADEKRLFRALFYGDPGAGKTTLGIECVKVLGGRTALVTTDSAWSVIYKQPPSVLETIDRYPFQGFKQIVTLAQARDQGIEPYASYKNLIWDTVSTGVDGVMRNLVDGITDNKIRNQQPHPLVEGWPHYRITERALRDAINILNKTDLNIIYTAHIRDPNEQDKAKKRFAIRPNMPQASFNVVAQEVSLIGWLHTETKGGKYKIQTQPTLTETAKSQIPTIPQDILEVSEIPELVAKWVNQ